VFGNRAMHALNGALALLQYVFTIPAILFTIESFKTIIDVEFGIDSPIWIYAVLLVIILTPFALVRRIKKFSFTFLFGLCCVATAFTFTTCYVSRKIYVDGWGPGN
jgi:hypothetical protein